MHFCLYAKILLCAYILQRTSCACSSFCRRLLPKRAVRLTEPFHETHERASCRMHAHDKLVRYKWFHDAVAVANDDVGEDNGQMHCHSLRNLLFE